MGLSITNSEHKEYVFRCGYEEAEPLQTTGRAKMDSLLVAAEGGLVPVYRKSVPWAGSFENAKAGSLWSVSYEALDQLVSLAFESVPTTTTTPEKDIGDEAQLSSMPRDEIAPSSRGLTCLACGIPSFESRKEQAAHFSTDEHRAAAALRRAQSSSSASPAKLKEEEKAFEEEEDEEDEEEEEEEDDASGGEGEEGDLTREERSSTVRLPLGSELALSMSPALLGACSFFGGRSGQSLNLVKASRRAREVLLDGRRSRFLRVAVLALRSGKFAGAIFEGRRATHHRTFARYTTRRGQGGAQSTIDGTGRAPKSIGSQLRRHGERALAEEIKALLEEWRSALDACDLIVVSVPRVMRPVLFNQTPIDPRDQRVQRLPFALRRTTLNDVKQAYDRLGLLIFHTISTKMDKPAESTPEEKKKPVLLREKTNSTIDEDAESFSPPVASESSQKLLAACEANDTNTVLAILDEYTEKDDEDALDLDSADPSLGLRPLHLAAKASNVALVSALLKAGANPAALDDRQRPPYFFASDKKTREAFRIARAELGEDARDWTAAAVPEAIDSEARAAKQAKERDKKKRQRDRQKQAKLRAQEEALRRADAEAARLAARNARLQLDTQLDCCDFCKKPIRSTPFTRLDYQYCSAECSQQHRRLQCAQAAESRIQGRRYDMII